jgi:glycosyltransferase involved in cell wall biosynthesis
MYNEEAIAQESIETILHYTRTFPPVVTLVVVNDGSKDRTESIIRNATKNLDGKDFVLITHPVNQGYGAALRTGVQYAIEHCYDYVFFMDSDLTNHPKYLKDFYEKMLENWDYIKATRYSKGGSVVGVSWKHRLISFVGNIIARKLYGLPLTDITNGFRAVKTDILKRMDLHENDFAIIMEELCQAKCLTLSFTEIPYVLTSRQEGQGRTRFSYSPRTCIRYLRYAIKSRI